jgi:hypothetical protein
MHALKSLLMAACFVLAAPGLQATPLVIGSTVVPQALADPSAAQVLGSTTGNFDFGSGPGHLTGSFEQGVAVDPFGLTCAGCLDFYFSVHVDGGLTAGINFLLATSFKGFATSVGYIDEDGVKTPLSASRGSASPVGFRFVDPNSTDFSHVIGPGQTSATLIIATDATAYDRRGSLSLFGGRDASQGTVTINTGIYQPVAVPEPAEWVLFTVGLAGLARRRKL